ncbi:MAG: Uma2 family endonuclease [candidate division KSB1 bacterium]|nr:Uma2 family endonuclease [candidate division KSB1 bacterium]MDZ7368969.1 Uma2 family endonuclease [candidate division KSB1 bacterium]MDZ7406993.1 Uma2 family endonuclease [candidate division KSB1 bacterium]
MAYSITKTRKTPSRQIVTTGGLVTFDQFYEIVEENVKADLLDGKIIRDSPAVPRHGKTCMWFSTLLTLYVQKFDLGEINGGTTTVRLSNYQGPEPDVFFVRKSRLGIIGEKYIEGPPDLCIEVISKSSRKIDRGRKFVLYAEYGVKEYWIVDPLRFSIEFYENQDGEWLEIQPDEQGRLHSKVLADFWLKAKWFISAQPLPPVAKALEEILGKNFMS